MIWKDWQRQKEQVLFNVEEEFAEAEKARREEEFNRRDSGNKAIILAEMIKFLYSKEDEKD